MKNSLFLTLGLSCFLASVSADSSQTCNDKNDTLELSYIFNKTYNENLNYNIIVESGNSDETRVAPEFGWGEQGQLTWTKRLPGSIYSIMTSFYAAHNSFNYHKSGAALSSQESFRITAANNYLGQIFVQSTSSSRPISYTQHNQFNFYGLDLFVKSELKKTKHAIFAVYGGAIVAGYNFKNVEKASGYDFLTNQEFFKYRSSDTDYFVGPNLKIHVTTPFFHDHFKFDLRAGAGFMMSFDSVNAYLNSYDALGVQTAHSTYSYSNTFRLAYQYDVLAQVSFCYENFCLSSGIEQFYYLASRPYNLIIFGGPFIKASYSF